MARPLASWLLALWMGLAGAASASEEPVSIRVTPRIATAPATVFITVIVNPHVENRTLVVEDDSESYYRRSSVPLGGEGAARTHSVRYQGLPAGEHLITAEVVGENGHRAAVSTIVTVIGSAGG